MQMAIQWLRRTGWLALAVLASGLVGAGPSAALTIYVTNRDAGELSIIDGASNEVVKRIPVGKKPTYVAVTPDGRFVLVTATGDSSLTVLDAEAREVIATIPLGDDPKGINVTPDGRYAFAVDEGDLSHDVRIFEVATWREEAVVPVGMKPHNTAFAAGRGMAYVSNGGSHSVSRIRLADLTAAGDIAIAGDGQPHNLAVTPDGRWLLVTNKKSDDLAFVDLDRGEDVTHVGLSPGHYGIDISPDGATAYVSGVGGEVINVVDVAGQAVTAQIPVGPGPHGVRFTPDGRYAYVAVTATDQVVVIDTRSRQVVARIDDAGFPFWVAIH